MKRATVSSLSTLPGDRWGRRSRLTDPIRKLLREFLQAELVGRELRTALISTQNNSKPQAGRRISSSCFGNLDPNKCSSEMFVSRSTSSFSGRLARHLHFHLRRPQSLHRRLPCPEERNLERKQHGLGQRKAARETFNYAQNVSDSLPPRNLIAVRDFISHVRSKCRHAIFQFYNCSATGLRRTLYRHKARRVTRSARNSRAHGLSTKQIPIRRCRKWGSKRMEDWARWQGYRTINPGWRPR